MTSSSLVTPYLTIEKSSLLPKTFNTPIRLKLDEDNYLLWQQQILATVEGLNLLQFLDESWVSFDNTATHSSPKYRPSSSTRSTSSCLTLGLYDRTSLDQDGGPSYFNTSLGSVAHVLCHTHKSQDLKAKVQLRQPISKPFLIVYLRNLTISSRL